MPFDAFNLNQLRKEMLPKLLGAKVEKICMPDGNSVVLFLRATQSYRLFVGLDSQLSAFCLIDQNLQNAQPSFLQHLRRHLLGAKLIKIFQPRLERCLHLKFATKDELGYSQTRYLVCEIMGRYSNLFLLDGDKKILQILKQFSAELNAKRLQINGVGYLPPPEQSKVDISVSSEVLRLLDPIEGEIKASDLMACLKGFALGTLQALICDYFLQQKNDKFLHKKNIEKFLFYVNELYQNDTNFLQPEVVLEGNIDFNCLPQGKQNALKTNSLNEAASMFVLHKLRYGKLDTKRNTVLSQLRGVKNKLDKKIAATLQTKESCKDFEKKRQKGDLILAHQHTIQPKATQLVVQNFFEENMPKIVIDLDASLNAAQNAQKYFKRYGKEKRAFEYAEQQLQAQYQEQEYFLSLIEQATKAESVQELDDMTQELSALGLAPKSNTAVVSQPYKEQIEGYTILVGKNNVQNDQLCRQARGNDLWLHVQGYSGSHVILQGNNPPQHIIFRAASLAAHYSRARHSPSVAVDCTQLKYVKRLPSAPLGKVTYVNQRTLYVEPKA